MTTHELGRIWYTSKLHELHPWRVYPELTRDEVTNAVGTVLAENERLRKEAEDNLLFVKMANESAEALEGQVAMLTVALGTAEAERDAMRAMMHVSTTGTIALGAKGETHGT